MKCFIIGAYGAKMGGSGWSRLRLRFHPGILIPTPVPIPLGNNYTAPIPVPIPAILTPIPVPIPVPYRLIYFMIFRMQFF